MARQVIGIDLGTTNSVVATVDDNGIVVVLPNADGGQVTPSVVYFEPDGTALVGSEAVREAAFDPENGVRLVKRSMGTEFPLHIRGQQHTPESISALILRQLVSAALGGVPGGPAEGVAVSAVITVPAYFGTAEREATHQAGVIAGLDVLELLDEPVAAATHYGLATAGDRTVLVYDLGGGTFDTTVLRIENGAVRVLATDGHHELGGADVDRRLLDLVTERLAAALSPDEVEDLTDDQAWLAELVLDVEVAKKDLSKVTSREISVRTPRGRAVVTITRSDLDEACSDLYSTTAEIIERVLGASRIPRGLVDEVIMVGGSSRIPVLAERLTAMLGRVPQLVDPDLAVAKGAALRAHHLVGSAQMSALTARRRGTLPGSAAASNSGGSGPYGGARRGSLVTGPGTVTPVTPRAVGILIEDSHDPAGQRSFIAHMVTANTPLPVDKTEHFGTILLNQDSVRIQVYEQSGPVLSPEVGHNRRVLDGELSGLGTLPAGSVIQITLRIAIDGRLMVIAHEPRSRKELTLEAFVEGVIDSAEAQRLMDMVSQTRTRG
ncbi:MAG: 2-alkenal reductase [Actinomycetia bacterium]|nr:2-alkenal reductase [Actinomycetes bacterium]